VLTDKQKKTNVRADDYIGSENGEREKRSEKKLSGINTAIHQAFLPPIFLQLCNYFKSNF